MLKADENLVIIDEPIKILKKRSYRQRTAKSRQISYDEEKDEEEQEEEKVIPVVNVYSRDVRLRSRTCVDKAYPIKELPVAKALSFKALNKEKALPIARVNPSVAKVQPVPVPNKRTQKTLAKQKQDDV